MSALLEIEDLKVSFGGRTAAVRGASLRVEKGETHCLVGESGCGKSVTALSIMNLLARGGRQPGDEVGTSGLGREQLALEAGGGQVIGEEFLRRELVSRRVDGVEADQPRKQLLLLGHRLDVPAMLARVRAACLCSSAEGLSNALMEAMAARLPIVATAVGGNPEVVAGPAAGVLLRERSAAAIVAAYLQLTSATEASAPSRAATREYAHRFSWDEPIAAQLRLFEASAAHAPASAPRGRWSEH